MFRRGSICCRWKLLSLSWLKNPNSFAQPISVSPRRAVRKLLLAKGG